MTANFHRLNDLEAEIDDAMLAINLAAFNTAGRLGRNPLTITDADVSRFEALRDALAAALAQFAGEGQ